MGPANYTIFNYQAACTLSEESIIVSRHSAAREKNKLVCESGLCYMALCVLLWGLGHCLSSECKTQRNKRLRDMLRALDCEDLIEGVGLSTVMVSL